MAFRVEADPTEHPEGTLHSFNNRRFESISRLRIMRRPIFSYCLEGWKILVDDGQSLHFTRLSSVVASVHHPKIGQKQYTALFNSRMVPHFPLR